MEQEQLNKRGRPTDYNSEIAEEICDAIASESKGLRKLIAENPHWPKKATIMRWRKKNPDFRDQYALAKVFQIESLVDDMLDIADDSGNDYVMNDKGEAICDHNHIQRDRVRIDLRKWLASKLAPKIYGDKIFEDNSLADRLANLHKVFVTKDELKEY